MNIGFDVDETLTNSEAYIKKLCLEYIEKNNLPFKMTRPSAQSASDMFDWDFDTFSVFWNEYGYKYEESVPTREETAQTIKELKKQGYKIFIVTSRFTDGAFERTKIWLQKNDIPFDNLVVNIKNKTEYCLQNDIKIFVDDSLKVCEDLKKAGVRALFIDGYTNRDVKDYEKIYKLDEIKKYLAK